MLVGNFECISKLKQSFLEWSNKSTIPHIRTRSNLNTISFAVFQALNLKPARSKKGLMKYVVIPQLQCLLSAQTGPGSAYIRLHLLQEFISSTLLFIQVATDCTGGGIIVKSFHASFHESVLLAERGIQSLPVWKMCTYIHLPTN